MYLTTKTSIKDSERSLSELSSSLYNEEFASAISTQNKEINFKIKYGLQKVKCTIKIIEEDGAKYIVYKAKTHHDVIFNRGLELINRALSKDDKESWSETSIINSNPYENLIDSTCGHLFGDHQLLRMQAFTSFITLVIVLSIGIFLSYEKLVPMGVPAIAIIGISVLIFYFFCGSIMMRRLVNAGIDRRICFVSIVVSCFIPVLWSILIVIALVAPESYFLSDKEQILLND